MVPLGDYLKRLLVARRNKSATRFAFVEKLFLGNFTGFGMMRDEYDFNVAVFGRNKLVEKKKEAPRKILLHRVHRARGVQYAEDHGLGFFARLRLAIPILQVIL